jgi:hypothetical protein
MSDQQQYIYYGTKCTAQEVRTFIEHITQSNAQSIKIGRKPTPVCVWGKHGIGKTQLVETIAQENGLDFAYIAPAQFEEMGDLVGMPKIDDGVTTFVAPEWVPRTDCPGILLIDDVNRADDRILRGIMQLLQNQELVSWKLPSQWQIILTANPDGGDYSVTPMDDAMLTRMMHITMQFDVKEWAKWAEINKIDPRGINFVLTYPELVTGERTTPRTLVQFFESIASIEDLKANIGLVQLLADSCLDSNTATAFVAFVNNNLSQLVAPQTILNSSVFEEEVIAPIAKQVKGTTLRIDIIATLCTRLINHLILTNTDPSPSQLDNVKQFIKIDFIPNDIRLAMAQDLIKSDNPKLKMIMADPEIGKMLLNRM